MCPTDSSTAGYWHHTVPLNRVVLPLLAIGIAIVVILGVDFVRLSAASNLQDQTEPAPIKGGSLVIGGGGKLPDEVRKTFLTLAGGPTNAKILIVPTADYSADNSDLEPFLAEWRRLGADHASIFHTRSRDQSNDLAFVKPIEESTGVWFGGGRQDLLSQAYVGTEVEKALKRLLGRGGVVGGSSAGAAILTKVMISSGRREPIEGQGFDLLPDSIVDQHFLRRNRMGRLASMLKKHPELVGIGIDEKTALVVRGRQLSVVGESYVVACAPATKDRPERIDFLKPGDTTDLDTLLGPARVTVVPGIDLNRLSND